MDAIGQVVKHFQDNTDKALGDLEAMLAGIRYRIISGGKLLDPVKRPPGYRSEKLRSDLRALGARKTTKWGPTAIRGDLGVDTKKHIIEFFNLINKIPNDKDSLNKAFDLCANIYVKKVNEENPHIIIQEKSNLFKSISDILNISMDRSVAGKIPQGIIYSLNILSYDTIPNIEIVTKRVHAGDRQSEEPGDIKILQNKKKKVVFEVKGGLVTKSEVDRVLESHGKYDYALVVLGKEFESIELKQRLNELNNTYAINLIDYCYAILSNILINTSSSPEYLMKKLISIYNDVFCDRIENEESIKISLIE